MLAVGFLYMLFFRLRKFSFAPKFCWVLLSWKRVEIFKCWVFCLSFGDYVFFVFILLTGCITLVKFYVKPILHSCDKSHLVIVYNPFHMLLDSVCEYLFTIFAPIQERYWYVHSYDGFICSWYFKVHVSPKILNWHYN